MKLSKKDSALLFSIALVYNYDRDAAYELYNSAFFDNDDVDEFCSNLMGGQTTADTLFLRDWAGIQEAFFDRQFGIVNTVGATNEEDF